MPGGGLLHPGPLVAIAVLIWNDQIGKAHYPGLLTGKLSDVAGLFFFPLFLQATWEWLFERRGSACRPSVSALGVAVGLTVLCFAAVQTFPPATQLYRQVFGLLHWPIGAVGEWLRNGSLPPIAMARATPDPTDLVTLPAALLGFLVHHRRVRISQIPPTRSGPE